MLASTATKGAQTKQRLRSLALLGAFLITPLLFIGGPDYSSGPLLRSVWNLGHIGLFALFTLGIQPWRWFRGWRLWFAPTAILLALGLAIETIQSGLGRDMDWHDVLRNLIGMWLVLAWFPSRPTPAGGRVLKLSTALLAALELASTATVAVQQFQVHQQLPQLYDFTRSDPSLFWRGQVSKVDDASGGLSIHMGTETYSGATLQNLAGDWRDYQQLILTLHNPEQAPLQLTIRIHDVAHEDNNRYSDRFNQRLPLATGDNRFVIPLDTIREAPESRDMDMGRIRRLGLFATHLPRPRTVILKELRLQ
ncbi:MAG: succinyl-CoA synthetase subunit beta [Gammaproteobacteria bacterium]|nr:MAG: succinyl-CoA synthetase subunit beta [Gammaproteobacteria bacterium]